MAKKLLKQYTEKRERYAKLYQEAEDNYNRHYQLRETASDVWTWSKVCSLLQSKKDYYDMILAEIDDIIIALNDIIESEKNINIFQKRLDKS